MKYTNISNLCISQAVDELSAYLETTSLSKEDCIRTVFAIEEALLHYQAHFGEDKPFTLTYGKKWGKDQFSISVSGVAFNPFDIPDDEDGTLSVMQTLMGRMGLFPSWKYVSGGNLISMVLPKVLVSPFKKIGLAILMAVVLYLITLLFPETVRQLIYDYGVAPLTEVIIGVLKAVSGPLIFFSIACSMFGMGDIGVFGKIGKSSIIAFLLGSVFLLIFGCFWLVFLFPPVDGSIVGSNTLFEIYELLLDIIPDNFVGPFVDGNTMQIVTLALVFGMALLVLQKSANDLTRIFEQCESVLKYFMENIEGQIHIFVFLSIFGILLSGGSSMLIDSYQLLIYLVISSAIMLVYIMAKGSLTTHISPRILMKKMAPSFLIALSTASSELAKSTSLKICRDELGISEKLVNFSLSFGSAIYKPSFGAFLGVISFYLYSVYDLPISIPMILTLAILCIILSIATPKIPGGGLIVMSILFLQLGIPDEALTLAIIFFTLYDFPSTAINVASLQIELLCVAKKLNLLDEDILRKES